MKVYLDNNATTRVAPEALEEMMPFLTDVYGNPSSMHDFGTPVSESLALARSRVAGLLGAEKDSEIIFTSCATESDNTAIFSAVQAYPDRREIITSAVEHPAILQPCAYLEERGYTVHRVPVNSRGQLDLDFYRSKLSDRVALVSIMWANNETGTVFPVPELARMAREKGILFHTDAVQAVGKLPISLKDTCIDMLSFSGHKLHAPKGVGALYVRFGTRFRNFMRGGHQERGRRAGTENSASIAALGRVCRMAEEYLASGGADETARLRDRLEQGILSRVTHAFVTGDARNRTPNTSNIAFEYVEGEGILLKLNHEGIAASSGSACTSGSLEPSHVMMAMKVPFTAAHGTIRFSLSRYTTQEEIDYVVEKVPRIIADLRAMSPYWKQVAEGAPAFNPDFKGTLGA
ncbi:MAG: cysteine desulfurase NifS [Succinivibrionaceae bacterium]|nr:cysteine desulfurase NifS [Succinivibrionaceae bacterium]